MQDIENGLIRILDTNNSNLQDRNAVCFLVKMLLS